jgi:hypothetical protein
MDSAALEHLDTTVEVHVQTPTKQLPIWAVVTDGEAYIRSYNGPGGAWYRRALRERRVVIDGTAFSVEPEPDDAVNANVSQAFRDKYGARSPRPTEGMVSAEVAATTLRLG